MHCGWLQLLGVSITTHIRQTVWDRGSCCLSGKLWCSMKAGRLEVGNERWSLVYQLIHRFVWGHFMLLLFLSVDTPTNLLLWSPHDLNACWACWVSSVSFTSWRRLCPEFSFRETPPPLPIYNSFFLFWPSACQWVWQEGLSWLGLWKTGRYHRADR